MTYIKSFILEETAHDFNPGACLNAIILTHLAQGDTPEEAFLWVCNLMASTFTIPTSSDSRLDKLQSAIDKHYDVEIVSRYEYNMYIDNLIGSIVGDLKIKDEETSKEFKPGQSFKVDITTEARNIFHGFAIMQFIGEIISKTADHLQGEALWETLYKTSPELEEFDCKFDHQKDKVNLYMDRSNPLKNLLAKATGLDDIMEDLFDRMDDDDDE